METCSVLYKLTNNHVRVGGGSGRRGEQFTTCLQAVVDYTLSHNSHTLLTSQQLLSRISYSVTWLTCPCIQKACDDSRCYICAKWLNDVTLSCTWRVELICTDHWSISPHSTSSSSTTTTTTTSHSHLRWWRAQLIRSTTQLCSPEDLTKLWYFTCFFFRFNRCSKFGFVTQYFCCCL